MKQNIYQKLQSTNPGNVEQLVIVIHEALNAAHVTGSMLEHIEEATGSYELKTLLDSLSAKKNLSEWNEELREIGVGL